VNESGKENSCQLPNQAVCALRFFYRVTLGLETIPERIAYAREPRKLPIVLNAGEVVRFLEAVPILTSSITAARPGTNSAPSHGASCPSDCDNGPAGFDQRELV
jgi:hypothetical protein